MDANTHFTSSMSKIVLIADDDTMITQLFNLGFEKTNQDVIVRSAATGERAIASMQEEEPHVLILDIRIPKGDGFAVLEHMKERHSQVPVIVLTNYRDDAYEKKCAHYGVKDYIVKHDHKFDKIMERVCEYIAD